MGVKGKRRPTHPGELLREETLPAAGLTPTELAARLGVSRRGINELLQERRSVNPDLAHRLARVFNTTPSSGCDYKKLSISGTHGMRIVRNMISFRSR
jgi:addiction module HigA family antidote